MRSPLDRMRIRPCQFGVYSPLTNTFGMVRGKATRAHQGWDLEAPPGTRTYAVADGEATAGVGSDYGNWILLRFQWAGQTYYGFYAHLQSGLVNGTSVPEGKVLGLTGMTGNARGILVAEAHLHFEIRTDANVGGGLVGRVDPGTILGFQWYSCFET